MTCIRASEHEKQMAFYCHFLRAFLLFTAFRQRKINAHVAAKIPSVLRFQSKTNDQTVSLVMRFCLGRCVPKATPIVLNIPPQDGKCVITQYWRNNTDILLASLRVAFTDRQCQPKAEFLIFVFV